MERLRIFSFLLVILSSLAFNVAYPEDFVKKESLNLLFKFCDRLQQDQVAVPADSNFGAIRNPESLTLSEASEEAVFPLAMAFKKSYRREFGVAALRSANRSLRLFLDQRVLPDKPTVATLNHLLGVALAYPILERHFPAEIQSAWKKLFAGAGEKLMQDLEQHANAHSSTELALAAASLAALHQISPDHRLRASAEKAAFTVLERMTSDGFIAEYDFLSEEDFPIIAPGRMLETSLPALAVFSSLLEQSRFSENFVSALADYLYLVYPDGMLDNAWGTCASDWRPSGNFDTWGSQAAFCIFAEADPRFYTAALRNLQLVAENMKTETSSKMTTNLPVIRRAFGLALTLALEAKPPAENKVLPADIMGWYKHFDSQNLVVIRTQNYMATVSGYRSGEAENRSGGGMISTFWDREVGLLQTSTPNQYNRTGNYFPELPYAPLPLSARIECGQAEESFSNLYDLNCRVKSRQNGWQEFQVLTAGELTNAAQQAAGVKYLLKYYFSANQIKKDLRLNYSGKKTEVRIVEPFLIGPKTEIYKKNASLVVIKNPGATWILQIEAGEGEIDIGAESERYQWPISGLQSLPVTIKLRKRKNGQQNRLVYSLEKVVMPSRQLADFRIE